MAQKPCKFNFINLAVAVAFHPNALRMIDDFQGLEPGQRGAWTEWLVAQEIFRRTALSGHDPERTGFWKSKEHEIDFVIADGSL